MERQLHQNLDQIRQDLLRMGAEVEKMIDSSMRSLVERDNALAEGVIERDAEVDRLEKALDEACLNVLATQQPTAVDLRFLVAVMKITNDLERMGDSAVNIAKSAAEINSEPPLKPYIDLPAMADIAAADGARQPASPVFNRFWFAGEWMQMDVDAPRFGDPSFDGYYAQAGIYLTPGDYRRFKTSSGAFDRQKPGTTYGKDGRGAMELVARVSNVNLNDAGVAGGEQDNITVGFNWYLNPATRFMLNWVNADVADFGEADFILARWQVDF